MMIKFSFNYEQRFTREQAETFNKLLEGRQVELDGEPDDDGTYRIANWHQEYVADIEAIYVFDPDIKIQVVGVHKVTSIQLLLDKIDDLSARLEAIKATEQLYNQKCEVHVPGLGLLAIEETMVLEDACTDNLDYHLKQGWRIVAACPQPDQRRPDYVLGRTKRHGTV